VLGLIRTIEPKLKEVAGHVIDTNNLLNQVVADVLHLVDTRVLRK
jgi:hypothetical protein